MTSRQVWASVGGLVAGGEHGIEQVWDLLLDTGAEARCALPSVDWREFGRRFARDAPPALRLARLAMSETLSRHGPLIRSVDPARIGVVMTPFSTANIMANFGIHLSKGGKVAVTTTPLTMSNAVASYAASWIGAAGPAWAVDAACASSLIAVHQGAELIRSGQCDLCIVGGADCQVELEDPDRLDMSALTFQAMRVSSDISETRPFDIDRKGMFVAPGAAFLVLSSQPFSDDATGSQVTVGPGASVFGGADMFAPEEDGYSVERVIRAALNEVDDPSAAIDLVVAHGTGTKRNDAAEAAAIASVFTTSPIVTSVKGLVGHTGFAAGSMNAAVALLSLARGIVPPVGGLRTPDFALNFPVGAPKSAQLNGALVLAIGLGGMNAALRLSRDDSAD